MHATFTSSQAFIKALKSSTDPPQPNVPVKIVLAREAWQSQTFNFPNKDEVIVDWILNVFTRDKSNNEGSIVIQVDYWTLLDKILQHAAERNSGVWIGSLLSRVQYVPVVTTWLRLCQSTAPSKPLVSAFSRCTAVLWPHAASRANLDTLTEAFGATLQYIDSQTKPYSMSFLTKELEEIFSTICISFRKSLGNASNRKKVFASFTQQYLLPWLRCIPADTWNILRQSDNADARKEAPLHTLLALTGVDILFFVDALKDAEQFIATHFARPFSPTSDLPVSQLSAVPTLFLFFTRSIHKNRHSIFSQGSSAAQSNEQTLTNSFRECALKAFSDSYDILKQWHDRLDVWQCTLALVKTLRDLQVVTYGARSTNALGVIASWCTDAITGHGKDESCQDVAVRILKTIAQIDFEIVAPYIKPILTKLLTFAPKSSNQELLRLHLEYHSKTRTIPACIGLFLDCFSTLSESHSDDTAVDPRQVYFLGTSGALFTLSRAEELRKATRVFVTYTQLPELVRLLCEALHRAWHLAEASSTTDASTSSNSEPSPERKKKRVKVDPFTGETESSPAAIWAAVKFALTARLASIVLPALPTHLLDSVYMDRLRDSIHKCWNMIIQPAIWFTGDGTAVTKRSWARQLVSSAGLKLHHTLSHTIFLPNLPATEELSAHVRGLLVESGAIQQELFVECMRISFDRGLDSLDPTARASLISILLSKLEPLREQASRNQIWDAQSSSLSKSENVSGTIALFHLTMDRWLLDVNRHASPDQLKQLAEICLATIFVESPKLYYQSAVTPLWVMKRALTSSIFWELQQLRDAFLEAIDGSLKSLDDIDTADLLDVSSSSRETFKPWHEQQMVSLTGAFTFLLSSPAEYIPRQLRGTYLQRALVADLCVWTSAQRDRRLEASALQASLRIRCWMAEMAESHPGLHFTVHVDKILDYTLRTDSRASSRFKKHESATLRLCEILFRKALQQALQSDEGVLDRCCKSLHKHLQSTTTECSVAESIFLRFVQVVIAECPTSEKLADGARASIRSMQRNAEKIYTTRVTGGMDDPSSLQGWRACLVLRRWLGGDGVSDHIVSVGRELLTTANAIKADSSYLKQVFGLICDELHVLESSSRQDHLLLITAVYVSFYGKMSIAVLEEQDNDIGSLAKFLLLEDYVFVLDIIRDSLTAGDRSPAELRAIVHFMRSFCRFGPPGHVRSTQEHLYQCLRSFLDKPVYTQVDAGLCLEVLELIHVTCSIRAHFLRQLEVSLIWTILVKLLSPSSKPPLHMRDTSYNKILHLICSITGTIIRLRRDLVASTIPHLVLVLRHVLDVMRRPRIQLGQRQLQLVANSLPWWLSPMQPCGVEEVRIVSRTLTALEAKTVPRIFAKSKDAEASAPIMNSSTTQKAESLSRPFSKHAPYVLQAYLKAETDALCTYPLALRRELEPGLWALCGMMNEHGRDALMAQSLGAAEKAAMKNVWKDYDKQKYVGKG